MINNKQILTAVNWLKSGDVIAYPTESVYGLGCDPKNDDAIKKILQIKQRSASKGLILVASDISQILPYVKPLSADQKIKITTIMKHPITWLIPAKDISSLLTGIQQLSGTQKGAIVERKIAIRISNHPTIIALCRQFGHPIVSTSANLSGRAMCWSEDEVRQQLKVGVKYILQGKSGNETRPSEIRDLISGCQIRK